MSATQAQVRIGEPPRLPRPRWGRWLLALIAVVVTGLGLVSGWRWISAPERFPLKAVRVDGRPVKVTEAELREAISPHINRGMLALDLVRIRRAVEALPWVERAGVRRRWPGLLVIDIRERKPVARWGEAALITEAGLVFAPAPASFPAGLPQLSGPAGSEREVLERYRRLSALFSGAGLQLLGLQLDSRRSWRATLDEEVVVELGSGPGDQGVERFTRVFSRIAVPAEARLARVDLRYPNGFALAWEKQAAVLR